MKAFPLSLRPSPAHATVTPIEILESRIAPAIVVSPASFTYDDSDGDLVTVKSSVAGIWGPVGGAPAGATLIPSGAGELLTLLELPVAAAGATLSISAEPVAGGDGFVNVGRIDASTAAIDLKSVTVDGDLGEIDAGDGSTATLAIATLKVQSLGMFDFATADFSSDFVSTLDSLGKLDVKSDVAGTTVSVLGDIASIKIGGSLLGGDGFTGAGFIGSSGSIGSVKIGGSLVGTEDSFSGTILALGDIGPVKIGGSMLGGGGFGSASVHAVGSLGNVKVGGSLLGGEGFDSATIVAEGGPVGDVKIGGSMLGGEGEGSAAVFGVGIGNVKVAGNLLGRAPGTANIVSEASIGDVGIKGNVIGHADFSGQVFSESGIGKVTIGGNLIGGFGVSSGSVNGDSDFGDLTVKGSILGGDGPGSGAIFTLGNLGVVKIGGDIHGGRASGSGSLFAGDIVSLSVGGSLIGGTDTLGDFIEFSGVIDAGNIGPVMVKGSIIGGSALAAGGEVSASGGIFATRMDSLTIKGSIIAGVDGDGELEFSGAIQAGEDIGPLTIKGSILGNPTERVVISAVGQDTPPLHSDVAIASISVKGNVEFADIFGGFDFDLDPVNGDAQVGAVTVGGDWIASTITAGIEAGTDGKFGTTDDVSNGIGNPLVLSRIGAVAIDGKVAGTGDAADSFAFQAEEIESLSIGGVAVPLTAGAQNDNPGFGLSGTTGFDVVARELPLAGTFSPLPAVPAGPAAVFVDPKTVTYVDSDGDAVKVTSSLPIFTPLLTEFTFTPSGFGQQLQKLTLPAGAAGATIKITAEPATPAANYQGDGFVNVGAIDAATNAIDLKSVQVDGDLGQIDAGDATATTAALGQLKVQSLGMFGTFTQAAGGSLVSTFAGGLGKLDVKSDVWGAVTASSTGGIGSVAVDGSLNGRVLGFGSIAAAGAIGGLNIGEHLVGSDGEGSGGVRTDSSIASLKIGGSMLGGSGFASGGVRALGTGGIGKVGVGGLLLGGAIDGEQSAGIDSGGPIGDVKTGGSVIGGAGIDSARISSATTMGKVKLGRDLIAGDGEASASVTSGVGGASLDGAMGDVSVKGSIVAGMLEIAPPAAAAHGGATASFSVSAGTGDFSARIFSDGTMGRLKVGGSIIGGVGHVSGSVVSEAAMGDVSVKGSLIGGSDIGAGQIFSDGAAGNVKIGGDIIGGSAALAGRFHAIGSVGIVKIGGSLFGGSTYDVLIETGSFMSDGDIGDVAIKGSIIGGYAGSGGAFNEFTGALVAGGRINSVTIKGSIVSGIQGSPSDTLNFSGAIVAGDDIGAIVIKGSLLGNPTQSVLISARGSTTPAPGTDVAIASLMVKGNVEYSDILGGYARVEVALPFPHFEFLPVNADAQIGPIDVGGDWVASNLSTGIDRGSDGLFGEGGSDDDTVIPGGVAGTISSIASIIIAGKVMGSSDLADSFAFQAQHLVALSIGGNAMPLTAAPHNDALPLSSTTDGNVIAREFA